MKKKTIGILVVMLLIATAVLPAAGIVKESAVMEFESIDLDNLKMAVDPSDYITSDDLYVAVDVSNYGEIICTNDAYNIYEGINWKLYVTAYWDPPQERYICLWVDTATLPAGATFDPCNCGVDEVTSTLDWTPSVGQAGTYYITFYVGEGCYEPIGYFTVVVVVHPLELEPMETYEIYAGQEWHLELTAYWVPPQPERLICLWVDTATLPYGATFTPCHCDYGQVTSDLYWTPTLDQLGRYITVPLIGDTCGYYKFPYPIEIIVYPPVEGLHIDSKFQPEQVVYQHDPLYPPDDLTGGPCEYNAALGMVTGKNTYVFGHPYSDRNEIKMTCCNNYNNQVEFQWVLKIFPDNKEIWRSDKVTVPAKTTKTFTYAAPLVCPGTPFQWTRWNDAAKTKAGRIELSIDPDLTGGHSPCNCQKVNVNVVLHKTHDLDVLFVPFTFVDGPNFPAVMATYPSAFDTWRWFTLEPWWNAIYPLREDGLDTCRSNDKIQQNIKVAGVRDPVHNLSTFQALTRAQVHNLWNNLFSNAIAVAWMKLFDRVVWLMHPDLLVRPGPSGPEAGDGWAHQCPPGTIKQGVLMNWNIRDSVPAHEIGHTYGLADNYAAGYKGDHSVGYWVNKNLDVPDSSYDLMAAVYDIWGTAEKTWIKKPNYVALLNRFTNQPDPTVLGISGFIDKNDEVELNPWYKLDEGQVDLEWGTTGDYLVRAYNNVGGLIVQAGFDVAFTITGDRIQEASINETIFAFRVEWMDDINRVDIVNVTSGEILASRTITSNSPQINIISPEPGEKVKKEPYEISWDGTDLDGGTLTYHVFLKNDTEEDWFPICLALQESSFVYNFSDLEKGNYQIQVYATDGFNVGEEITNFEVTSKGKIMMFGDIFDFTPFDKSYINIFFPWLLGNHAYVFPLLRQLLGL